MASVSEKQMAMAMEKMEKAKGVQVSQIPVVVPAKPVEEAEKPVEKAETKKVSKASSKE
jgi:hypothetical protein